MTEIPESLHRNLVLIWTSETMYNILRKFFLLKGENFMHTNDFSRFFSVFFLSTNVFTLEKYGWKLLKGRSRVKWKANFFYQYKTEISTMKIFRISLSRIFIIKYFFSFCYKLLQWEYLNNFHPKLENVKKKQ